MASSLCPSDSEVAKFVADVVGPIAKTQSNPFIIPASNDDVFAFFLETPVDPRLRDTLDPFCKWCSGTCAELSKLWDMDGHLLRRLSGLPSTGFPQFDVARDLVREHDCDAPTFIGVHPVSSTSGAVVTGRSKTMGGFPHVYVPSCVPEGCVDYETAAMFAGAIKRYIFSCDGTQPFFDKLMSKLKEFPCTMIEFCLECIKGLEYAYLLTPALRMCAKLRDNVDKYATMSQQERILFAIEQLLSTRIEPDCGEFRAVSSCFQSAYGSIVGILEALDSKFGGVAASGGCVVSLSAPADDGESTLDRDGVTRFLAGRLKTFMQGNVGATTGQADSFLAKSGFSGHDVVTYDTLARKDAVMLCDPEPCVSLVASDLPEFEGKTMSALYKWLKEYPVASVTLGGWHWAGWSTVPKLSGGFLTCPSIPTIKMWVKPKRVLGMVLMSNYVEFIIDSKILFPDDVFDPSAGKSCCKKWYHSWLVTEHKKVHGSAFDEFMREDPEVPFGMPASNVVSHTWHVPTKEESTMFAEPIVLIINGKETSISKM
jgi:hypothetical protein